MLKTVEEYKESLRCMRPNVYKYGECIKDVTEHPATKRVVECHAEIYRAAHDPQYADLLTTTSSITGERVSRYLSLIRSAQDLVYNCMLKRLMFNLTGTCTGGRCGGWAALNALWATTYEMVHGKGEKRKGERAVYHERLRAWLANAQEADITISAALTDPKGDRSLPPGKQADPDMYLRIVERDEDYVVVRGAKLMIAGVAAANELFIMPGRGLKAGEEDYAVAFAVPRDIEGLTIVETTHPGDFREVWGEGFDIPTATGISQAYLLFDDVKVPAERVFLCGEYEYARVAVSHFVTPYRAAMGGCVAGQGDVMLGAAALIAELHGLSADTFREKMIAMAINNETTFAVGVAAAMLGKMHPSGVWLPDMILANVNKIHIATLPYETKRLAQEIGGGIVETGCMPSYKDYSSPQYGALIQKYIKAAAAEPELRARTARLLEWLTVGAGIPGCMHGGGSPDVARRAIWQALKLEAKRKLATNLISWPAQ